MTAHDAFDAAVAAYALDALDAQERRAFEAHMGTCETCQAELLEMRKVVAALGSTVDSVAPPAALKARTIERAVAQKTDGPARTALPFTPPLPVTRVVRSPMSVSTWFAAAAAVVLIAGLVAYSMMLRSEVVGMRTALTEAASRLASLRTEVVELRRDSVRLNRTLSVLSAPTVLRVDLRGQGPAPASLGRAYVGGTQGLVFAASHLPALAADEVYQLWVIAPDAATPISAGVFPIDSAGDAAFSVELPPGAAIIKAVAVSVEKGPTGSAAGPKGPVLLMGAVGS